MEHLKKKSVERAARCLTLHPLNHDRFQDIRGLFAQSSSIYLIEFEFVSSVLLFFSFFSFLDKIFHLIFWIKCSDLHAPNPMFMCVTVLGPNFPN